MTKSEYREYLRDPHWLSKRAEALEYHGPKCNRCKGIQRLQVHHKSYARLWEEDLSDLEVLCRECHKKEHGITEIVELADGIKYVVIRLPDEAAKGAHRKQYIGGNKYRPPPRRKRRPRKTTPGPEFKSDLQGKALQEWWNKCLDNRKRSREAA